MNDIHYGIFETSEHCSFIKLTDRELKIINALAPNSFDEIRYEDATTFDDLISYLDSLRQDYEESYSNNPDTYSEQCSVEYNEENSILNDNDTIDRLIEDGFTCYCDCSKCSEILSCKDCDIYLTYCKKSNGDCDICERNKNPNNKLLYKVKANETLTKEDIEIIKFLLTKDK